MAAMSHDLNLFHILHKKEMVRRKKGKDGAVGKEEKILDFG